jgi:AcrR family transcriptional regulator
MGRPKVRTSAVRDDVVRCALDVLERDGAPAVSARRVAADAGTSTAALYEFFGDKAGLVRAVAFEGFVALQRTLDEVAPGVDERESLVALLAASRRFAVARPMLFELMYSRPFAEFAPGPDDQDAALGVYRTIVGAVRRWLRGAGTTTSATEAAHIVVAAHRGFVMTELAGIAGGSAASVEARYRRGVDAVLDGLLAGSAVTR